MLLITLNLSSFYIPQVARPENFREMRESAAQSSAAESSTAASRASRFAQLPSILSAGLSEFVSPHNNPFLSLLSPAREARNGAWKPVVYIDVTCLSNLLTLTEPPLLNSSLEHVRQGILTMHTLLSTMDAEHLGVGVPSDTASPHAPATQLFVDSEVDMTCRVGGGASAVGLTVDPSILEDFPRNFNADDSPLTERGYASSAPAESPQSAGRATSSSSSIKRFFLGQWLDVKDTVNQWLEATVMAINVKLLHFP